MTVRSYDRECGMMDSKYVIIKSKLMSISRRAISRLESITIDSKEL